tara:strand:- start:7640 stop:7945 length:306 start_codon:yes stop_codon:yes gene_type:complete
MVDNSQKLILVGATAGVFFAIGGILKYIDKLGTSTEFNNTMTKYLFGLVILLIWCIIVSSITFQMQINEVDLKIEKYHKQFHSDIMKKYIDIEEECGRKLK